MFKKIIKTVLVLFFLLFILLAALPLVIQTRPFKNWLTGFVEKTVNRNLQAELNIGRIDGNFFTTLQLSNVHLYTEDDTLVALPSLSITYKPLFILQKKINVTSAAIDSPTIHLRQFADSSWSFQRLVKSKSAQTAKDSSQSSKRVWTIQIDQFDLNKLTASISAIDSWIPKRIDNFSFSLGGLWGPLNKKLDVRHLELAAGSPDIRIRKLVFLVEQDTSATRLQNFQLETGRNRVTAQADLNAHPPTTATATLSTAPVDISEFHMFLPRLTFKGHPVVELTGQLLNEKLTASLDLKSQFSTLSLNANIDNFSYLLGDSTKAEPTYQLNSSINNIFVSDWTPTIKNRIRLNAEIQVKGQGLSAKTAKSEATVHIYNSELDDRTIDSISMLANYNRGAAHAKIEIQSQAGQVNAGVDATSLFASPRYQAKISTRALNLADVLLDSTLASNLNLDLDLSGEYFSLEKLTGTADVIVSPSRIFDIEIDSLAANLSIAAQEIRIRSFYLKHQALAARAKGLLSLRSMCDLSIDVSSANLMALNSYIKADTLAGNLDLSAHLAGPLDSLVIAASLNADSLRYNTYAMSSLKLNADVLKHGNGLVGSADAEMHDINIGEFIIQDVNLDTGLSPDMLDLRVELKQNSDIQSRIHAQYLLNELPIVYLKQFDVDLRDRQWRGGSDSTSIVVGDGEYIVTNFLIQNINADSVAAQIYADGVIRFNGTEDFLLRVQNYNLAPISQFLEKNPDLGGRVNLEIKLSGVAESPKLTLTTLLSDVHYNNFSLKKLSGAIHYADEKISTNILIIPHTDSLVLKGYVPADFSLADQSFVWHKSRPFDISLQAAGLPIQNFLPPGLAAENFSGTLSIDVHAQNTLSNITPGGSIAIRNGRIKNEKYGVYLNELNVLLNLEPDRIVLDQFIAKQDNGTMTISGFAALENNIFSRILKAVQLNIQAKNFYLSQKAEHKIQIDSNIDLSGPLDSLRMDGNLEIVQASFYLPALMKKNSAAKKNTQMPLLVEALSSVETDTLTLDTLLAAPAKKTTPPVLKNLRGALKVEIAKNFWIKNNNMRVEIGGDVDIIKNADFYELFGTINILRGQYDFLARRFKFSKGAVSFQGGEKINPMLDITADYTFRDSERDEHTVYLNVTDKMMEPDINFKLDNSEITEGEAVSYILFNRSPEEVGAQQSGSGPSQTGYLATDLVYGVMSAELSKRFGQQLGVDYIEIKGQDNLKNATFIVGKYITQDLFMSYEHSIGTMEEDRSPQVITVELEMTKYIFLQLVSGDTKTTGFDLILKFDK